MLVLIFLALELFLVSIQTTLLPFFPQALGQPDLIFILVAFISYRFDWFRGLILICVVGWMLDVVSSLYMGVYLIQYLSVFIILRLATINSPVKEEAYQIPLTAVFYLVSQLVLYFLFSQLTPASQSLWSWTETIQDAIVLLIATVPCFLFFNLLFERFSRRRTFIHKMRQSIVARGDRTNLRYR